MRTVECRFKRVLDLLTKLFSVWRGADHTLRIFRRFELSIEGIQMKWFQNSYLVLATALVMGLCGYLWHVGRLADMTLIFLLAAGLAGASIAGQFLLRRLRKSASDRQQLLTRAERLKSHARRLMAQAQYDNLTGLGNRNLLADRFKFAMQRAMRNRESFALLMIDLNRFKSINDNYGHGAGDEVLITCAKRLQAAVRASDTVVRLGGDEFLLLIERFEKCNDVYALGQKLIDSLSEEIALSSGETVSVGASVGVAQFPKDGFDMGGLLESADQSMYECKTSGRMPLEFA